MSEKQFRWCLICIAAYIAVGVVVFGPATVQSEQARASYLEQCKAENAGSADAMRLCHVGGPRVSDGAPKAMLWPLWLSYTLASR